MKNDYHYSGDIDVYHGDLFGKVARQCRTVDSAELPAPAIAAMSKSASTKYSKRTASRANKAIKLLSGIKPGLGRRAFDLCFEMGDGNQVAALVGEILASDIEIARKLFFGQRSYRPSYPGDYPETHYARDHMSKEWLAIIVQHGIVALDSIRNNYGMRDKVAALLPAAAVPKGVKAETPRPGGVSAASAASELIGTQVYNCHELSPEDAESPEASQPSTRQGQTFPGITQTKVAREGSERRFGFPYRIRG